MTMGLSSVALYSSGSEAHGTNSRKEVEWGRKWGRRSFCYEWSCEGGMERLDRRSGGVGCCCWVGALRPSRKLRDIVPWVLGCFISSASVQTRRQ